MGPPIMLSLSRRLEAARKAFTKGDPAAVATMHDPALSAEAMRPDPSVRSWFGAYIGSMVYGGLDGIITTFAVVSGVAGADLGANIILILGIGNLLADGFSMGTGNYLATKSVREYYDREARRQAWEIDRSPEAQKVELRTLFLQRGYAEPDAERLVEVQTRDKARWVNAIMIAKLGMLKEEANPVYNAMATFISFVLAGSLPLLVYLVGLVTPIETNDAFRVSVLLSGLALFGLGAAKVFLTRLNPLRSGLEMLIVGGLAAVVAYVIGSLLKNIGG